ncbi:methionine aminopeptidase [Bacillus alkalicellulosilyticus]|uniref:methionine aminopeptidase n=1 Tax=Alkalihalobacterium alkalicellulosilyticum TaxID=1912214 RepID=UPI001FED06A8|nr:methionine aminopeptidase [Bacillus alkalicellulosilyticus]
MKQKKIENMKTLDLCPDCHGKGFMVYPAEHYFTTSYECAGCNGTGNFSEWSSQM